MRLSHRGVTPVTAALFAAMCSISACQDKAGPGEKSGSGAATSPEKGGGGTSVIPAASAASGDLKTEDEKTLYALGLFLSGKVSSFNLTPTEAEIVKHGFTDGVSGAKPLVELQVYGPKMNEMAQARGNQRAVKEKEKAKGYLEQAAKEAGAQKTESGLIYKTLKPGSGESPKTTDTVKVHYEGKLTDGTVFDSSIKRGEPVEFPLGGVIPCWREGVAKMKVGEKAKLICPSSIGYGDQGQPPSIPGGATLVFEVELLSIKK